MALPRTTPLVPADHAMVANSSACDSGSTTRPNHGPRSNPTGNSPHDSRRALSIPNVAKRSRVHSQALVKLFEPVSLGPIRLQSTSRWSITRHSSRTADRIRSTSWLLALAVSLSLAAAHDGFAITITRAHRIPECRLMRDLLDESSRLFGSLTLAGRSPRITMKRHFLACGLPRPELRGFLRSVSTVAWLKLPKLTVFRLCWFTGRSQGPVGADDLYNRKWHAMARSGTFSGGFPGRSPRATIDKLYT